VRRRARADRGWLGQALSILWPAISLGSSSLALADVKTVEAVAAPGETTVEVVARGRKQSAVVLLWLVVGSRVDAVGRRSHTATFGDHHRDPAQCDGVGRVR
jgi:hypothetical protein